MKVKILNVTYKSYWYSENIGEEFDVSYFGGNRRETYHLGKSRCIVNNDAVITELPKSFCVKRCDDGIKWGKYIDWLNKTYNTDFCGRLFNFDNPSDYPYYGVIDDEGQGIKIPFGTEIHIDDMIKHIDYMERHINGGEQFHKESQLTIKMNTQKLSRQGLKEIHSVACSTWKITLEGWGSRNPLEDYIELSQKEIDIMFNASDNNQKSILSKYLKQDDDSVDVSDLNISPNKIIDIRKSGEYENKSFWLSESYNWEIKKDSIGKLCLIPTKKK